MTAHRFVDLCAGAGAITLRLFGGERALPPTGWMGGKRRQAPAILDALGVDRSITALHRRLTGARRGRTPRSAPPQKVTA